METDLMIDKYDTSNFLDLIEKAKYGFNVCLSLESQGHKPLKDALLSCYQITKYIKEQDLKELLIKEKLIKEESFDIKNKAKYVLWLTMGKPDKSKKTDDEIRYKRDTARLRMYKRVLEKFILKDLSEDEAYQFLEIYGVYAIGNLKAIDDDTKNTLQKVRDTRKDNTSYTENDDEDDDDDDYEDESVTSLCNNVYDTNDDEPNYVTSKEKQKRLDKKESFEELKSILSSKKLHYKRLVIIKDANGKIQVCKKKKEINRMLNLLSLKKNPVETTEIDELIEELTDE